MAPAPVSEEVEAVIAVKNTFLHFDDPLGLSPRMWRRGSRAKTEPVAKFLEESHMAPEDEDEFIENENCEENALCEMSNPEPAVDSPDRQSNQSERAYYGTGAAHSIENADIVCKPSASRNTDVHTSCSPHAMDMRKTVSMPMQPHLKLQEAARAAPLREELRARALTADVIDGVTHPAAAAAAVPVGPQFLVAGGARSSTMHKAGGARPASNQVVPASARPQALELSVHNNAMMVRWTVDAKKLRGSDKGLVSPPFELPFVVPTPFKIMLSPKGGMSFGKAGGKGSILLKCGIAMEDALDSTRIVQFSLGSSRIVEMPHHCSRGPIRHNFAQNGVCGLPKDQQEWDFSKAVDDATQTVTVCIEIMPRSA